MNNENNIERIQKEIIRSKKNNNFNNTLIIILLIVLLVSLGVISYIIFFKNEVGKLWKKIKKY